MLRACHRIGFGFGIGIGIDARAGRLGGDGRRAVTRRAACRRPTGEHPDGTVTPDRVFPDQVSAHDDGAARPAAQRRGDRAQFGFAATLRRSRRTPGVAPGRPVSAPPFPDTAPERLGPVVAVRGPGATGTPPWVPSGTAGRGASLNPL